MKWIAALPLFALLACSPAADEGAAEEAAVAPAPEPAKPSVNLDATGITVPAQDGQAAVQVAFGTERGQVEDALASVLGSIKERASQSECPAGVISTTVYDGIVLNFQGGKFVGWMASGGDYVPDLPRAELAEAAGGLTEVTDSTLGAEFYLGKEGEAVISFLFDSDGDTARVSRLWAGTNCILR